MDPIGAEIRRELGRFGPALGLGEIVAEWPAAVGPGIARNAWPARLARDGTLHVSTRSSAWAFELTQLEGTIRARLGERLDGPSPPALRFAPGLLPEPGAESVPEQKQSVPIPGPAARAEGAKIAAGIAAASLRKAVARAAAASLARENWRASDRSV